MSESTTSPMPAGHHSALSLSSFLTPSPFDSEEQLSPETMSAVSPPESTETPEASKANQSESRHIRVLTSQEILDLTTALPIQTILHLATRLWTGLSSTLPQTHRTILDLPSYSTAMYMPSYTPRSHGIKSITLSKDGGSILGSYLLNSNKGYPLALLPGPELTGMRTALASILVTLARCAAPISSPSSIVVFGAGKQAEWAIRLATQVFPSISTVYIVNRSPARATCLAKGFMAASQRACGATLTDVKFEVIPNGDGVDHSELVADADMIFCCTPSTKPLFPAEAILRGRTPKFVSLVGSYTHAMVELDLNPLRNRSDVLFIADTKAGVMRESGEVHAAGMSDSEWLEIGDIPYPDCVSEKSPEWNEKFAKSTVIYKSVGAGIMDLAVAECLLIMARNANVGTTVPI